MRRVTNELAVLTIVLALVSGCTDNAGSEQDNHLNQQNTHTVSIDVTGTDAQREYAYLSQYITLPGHIGDISNLAYYDGKAYFVASQVSGSSLTTKNNQTLENIKDNLGTTSTASIFSINLDSTELTELTGYKLPAEKEEGSGGMAWINCLTIDDEGSIWTAESWSFYEYILPPVFDAKEVTTQDYDEYCEIYNSGDIVRKLNSSTGDEVHRINLDAIRSSDSNLYIEAMTLDDSGNVYLGYTDMTTGTVLVHVMSAEGGILFSHSSEGVDVEIIKMPGGRVAFSAAVEDEREAWKWTRTLQVIDIEARGIAETIDFPYFFWEAWKSSGSTKTTSYSILSATDEYKYDFFINNDAGIFGLSVENANATELFGWIPSNVDQNTLQDIVVISKEQFLVLSVLPSSQLETRQKRAELIILTKTLSSEIPQKTELTLATLYVNPAVNISNAVMEHNRRNPYFEIKIKNYNNFDQLSMDITTGNIPDLMSVNWLSNLDYLSSGLLADIYPFIDADPELTRDDFVPSALKAAEIDGKLYQIYPCYSVNTLVGNPSVVGEGAGWDMEEFKAVLNAHPDADVPFGTLWNKTDVFYYMVRYNADSLVDWENGTVHFDTPEFIEMLELVNVFPSKSVDYTGYVHEIEAQIARDIATGRQLLTNVYLGDFTAFLKEKALFGGQIVFKGFPCKSRNGHQISGICSLAITENSLHKEAAWDFVRTFLSLDWQIDNTQIDSGKNRYVGYFPTNRAALDYVVEKVLETDVSYTGADGQTTTGKFTQVDADLVINLINSSTSPWTGISNDLYRIIVEEAVDYFNGMATAEDAARIIQSRAGIYVAERS